MQIPFRKYHGCGNDFILVQEKDVYSSILKKLIIQACDRHTGIGADGFIVVRHDPLEMMYYNQDGSRAPMCGNGIRCFAQFCLDEGIVHKSEFTVRTLAGDKVITVRENGEFSVDMGMPIDDDLSLMGLTRRIWAEPYQISKTETLRLYTLFQSTIHTVVFVDVLDEEWMKTIGQRICEDPMFQEKTNVNFVCILDSTHLKMRTYERGCGMTLACGTGACASVVTAHRLGLCDKNVHVILPKGRLEIAVDDSERVTMTGPARCIAEGDYYYETN